MEDQSIERICAQVYKRFPNMQGKRPQVQPYGEKNYLLTFQASAKTANGHSIIQTIKVVASQDGKIQKLTTSR